jgi:hypothetical protein
MNPGGLLVVFQGLVRLPLLRTWNDTPRKDLSILAMLSQELQIAN